MIEPQIQIDVEMIKANPLAAVYTIREYQKKLAAARTGLVNVQAFLEFITNDGSSIGEQPLAEIKRALENSQVFY